MTGETNGYSLADIGALIGNRNYDGFGNQWWIILLFFLFAGNGWNNRYDSGSLTRSDMREGFDNQNVMRKLDNLGNGLCDGFYAQNTTMLNGFNTLGREIADNRFAQQQCCCETNRNIDSIRYGNAENTCQITSAIHAEGEETRKLIVANQMQELRDRLTAKDQELQTANFQLSQQAQTANIINQLQPVSKPAYLTCNPYQSVVYAYGNLNGCGCGCGY